MTSSRSFFILTAAAILLPNESFAQASPSHSSSVDEIQVIGSYASLLGKEAISPTDILSREDLDRLGATNFADVINTLTINRGAENNPDAFTQSATSGTSNINLRGLGVSSTLVLLNGRRTTQSAATTNTGVSFVDLNSLIPDIAVERIEILKDGASPLYGSDAVAGVVNFVTRKGFEGVDLQADYKAVDSEGDSQEVKLQALYGVQKDRFDLTLAASFSDVTELDTTERRLSVFGQDDVSSLGNPASFVVSPDTVPSLSSPTFVIDPTGCEDFGGIPFAFGQDTGLGTSGLCRFDFGEFFTLVPEQQKIEAYGAFDYRLTDDMTFGLEVSYADIGTTRGNSPSFPVLTQPIVPATHPDNVFGADVGYFGRIKGNGAPRFDTPHTSETWRIAADIQGRVGEDYNWTLSYVYAGNDHQQIIEDVVADRLVNALNGLGGADCNLMMGAPGQGACQYFNPFATSFTTSPNDPALLDFLVESQVRAGEARAHVVDALLTGPWFTLPGGKAEFALGAQYRVDEFRLDYDEFSNNDAFAFLIGNPDSEGNIGVASLFGEIVLPLTETLTAQAALRYEAYDKDIGDTLDPKIALAWQPTDLFKLRGSYATSFRAPSVSQTAGISTILNQASDPVTGTTSFVANRTLGNEALQPETAKNYTLGALWTPVPKLNLTIDYWNIQVEDVIVQENFQAVLDAFAQDSSRVVRAGDPFNGPVVQINTTRVNATSLDTSGVDIAIDYEVDLWNGVLRPQMEANYVAEYEIDDPQQGFVDGVGSRNFRNIGTSMPEWRANLGLSYGKGPHQFTTFVRYIDNYIDDQNTTSIEQVKVAAHTTIDVQYALSVGDVFASSNDIILTVGATNLTNEAPPQVATNGGYDTKIHDPRGRLLYLRAQFSF